MDDSAEKGLPDVPERFAIAPKPELSNIPDPEELVGRVQSDVEKVSKEFDTERNALRFEQEVREITDPYFVALAARKDEVKNGNFDDFDGYENITRIDKKRGGFMWHRHEQTIANLGGKWLNQDDRSGKAITKFSRMDIPEHEVSWDPSKYELLLRTDNNGGDAEFPKLSTTMRGLDYQRELTFEWDSSTKDIVQTVFAEDPAILARIEHTENLGENGSKFSFSVYITPYESSFYARQEYGLSQEEKELVADYEKMLIARGEEWSALRDKYPDQEKLRQDVLALKKPRMRETVYTFDPEKNKLVPYPKNIENDQSTIEPEEFKDVVKSLFSLIPTHEESLKVEEKKGVDGDSQEESNSDDEQVTHGTILTMALPGERLAA